MMKNESGRSMVEMLGVLAIIGVLSIGGIAGYTLAMNRYRANEILNTASMVAIQAMTANGGAGDTLDLSANNAPNRPACIAADTDIQSTANGIVTITVDGQNCAAVADLVEEIAGGKLVAGHVDCTAGCQLDMSNR